jgi:penicillin-binding protein 2
MRIKVIRIGIICLFLVIVLDLFYVQAIRGRYFYNLSKNNRIRVVPLEGWRGRILDRNGKVLADNRMSYNVMVTPQDVKDTQKLFHFLSEVLKIDQKKIIQKYRQREFTPYTPVNIVENISREQAIILEENKYRFPSLLVQESFKRIWIFSSKRDWLFWC